MTDQKIFRIYENSDINSIFRKMLVCLWEQAYKVKACLIHCIPEISEERAQKVAIHKVIKDFEVHPKDKVDEKEIDKLKEPYKMLMSEFFNSGFTKNEVIEILAETFKES